MKLTLKYNEKNIIFTELRLLMNFHRDQRPQERKALSY